ncbi:SIMPL domain-containing protein [candidate division SR1 bacterium]|nr:SIMPL domain-containing protein [candidate division SR1 bacterium]
MSDKLLKLAGIIVICGTIIFATCTYSHTRNLRTVSVSGQGIMKVQPDTLTLNFYVQDKGDTTKDAQTLVDNSTKQFVDAMVKLGIDRKKIQTSNYSVYPEYRWDDKTQENVLKGYNASQTIVITLNGDGFVGLGEKVLNLAPEFGNIMINGSNFTVTDKAKGENDARQLAIDAAYKKAQQLAGGTASHVGKVLSISESINAGGYYPMYANAKLMNNAEISMDESASLEAGQNEISVNVSVSYELK